MPFSEATEDAEIEKLRGRPRVLAAVLAALLSSFVYFGEQHAFGAQGYDPDVPYRTLETPHFFVMFPDGYGHIALRAARYAEDAREYLNGRYGWEPDGRISIIINDQTDSANGSATILPSKTITLFVTAPTRVSGLEDYDDWLSAVLIHELAHIYHLDMAYGLPWIGRLFLGKYVAMNQYTPSWITEGLAVYEETISSGAGRGRSNYVDMILRTAALADRFPTIDRGYRSYPNWPFANISYFFGGRFQLWLTEKYGEEALFRYHRIYAANPIPYITHIPALMVFDSSMESLWLTFEQEMKQEAALTLRRVQTSTVMPESKPVRLTEHGGECVGPRVTPDGQFVVYSTNSPVDGARIRRLRLDRVEEEVLVDDTLSLGFSFSPKGDAFYFQQAEINQRFYSHNNLYRYDVAREEFLPVVLDPNEPGDWLAPSGSLRAREPDVSSDGKRLVFVQSPYGANRLVIAWLESDGQTIHPKVLVPAEPDVQFSNPRFAPDGTKVAVARFKGGRRDIVIYDLRGQLIEEVTRDRAQDTDPTWSPDGRYLVFSSDRTGIYNLYAFEYDTKVLRQVTNLVSGAFQPSITPDMRTIVYRGYSADGFDVYKLPFEPEKSPIVPYKKAAAIELDTFARDWPPIHPDAPKIPPKAPFKDVPLPTELPENWSITNYSALDTILPFNDNWNLFPAIFANEREFFGSLTHFGSDVLGTHSYAANVTYGTFTNFVGGGLSYSLDVLEPTFTFLGQAQAVTYSNEVVIRQDANLECEFDRNPEPVGDGTVLCYGPNSGAYTQRRLLGLVSVGLPVRQRHYLSLSYVFERRDNLDTLPAGTLTGLLPRSGNFARVSLGYTYSDVRAFAHSISLERGPSFAIALQGLSKGLGSDYEEFVLTTEGRYYLDLPWRLPGLNNHVLATRLGGGLTAGPNRGETFRLGGSIGRSALTTTTDNFYPLRGLGTSALRGTAVLAGSMEYRAPIFRIDRGAWTLPITFEVVHAAVFADFGRVFDDLSWDRLKEDLFDEFAVGVGGELRGDIIFAYSLPLRLRLGYAHAIKRPTSLATTASGDGLYFQLGTLF